MDDEPPSSNALISNINDYYENLLGYSVKKTNLKELNEEEWKNFCGNYQLIDSSYGIYLPRTETAVIPKGNWLSLFHEYFGHGLFCEQSLIGKRFVDLEKKLLEEEKQEFKNKKVILKDVEKFREHNKTCCELKKVHDKNIDLFEKFAIFSEYFLLKKFGIIEKYELLLKQYKEKIDSVISFNNQYGDLATFYNFGLARVTTPERVRKLLQGIYEEKVIKNSKLVLLSGSRKPFSDIDLFVSSDYLQSINNEWIDLVVLKEQDFERSIKLFETRITHPIFSGEFVTGDKKYLAEKKKQLLEQPITEEAIQHNLRLSEEQKESALNFPENSKGREIGLSYAKTYLTNFIALRNGKKIFTKEGLDSYSQSENIKMKGGLR